MNEFSQHRRACLGAMIGVACTPLWAQASTYPNQIVRMVVPFPPGGATDFVGRILAEKLAPVWGQTVLVDNRGGASGMIGADIVAKSPPNGHTVLVSSTAEVAINQSLYKQMTYSPERDLAPVALAAVAPLVLVTGPSLDIRSLADLPAIASQRKAPITYASAGAGGVQHLAGALLESRMKIGLTHVPYRGAAPAVADVLGGQVDMIFSVLPPVIQLVKEGRLKAIAVTDARRVASLPNVPTANESLDATGFEISNWYGIFVAAGAPDSAIEALSSGVQKVVKMPDVRERMERAGADPDGRGTAEFREFWKAEIRKYAEIIRVSGATVG